MISNPVPYHENLNKTTVVYLCIPVIRCPASAVPHFFAASSSCLNASHVIWCVCKRMHMVKKSHWHPQYRGSRTLVLTPIIWPGVWLCYRPVSYTLRGCCLTTLQVWVWEGKQEKGVHLYMQYRSWVILSHLTDRVTDRVMSWGLMWCYSCFPFETRNTDLKRLLWFHSSRNMFKQVCTVNWNSL